MTKKIAIRYVAGGDAQQLPGVTRCVRVEADFDDSVGYITVRTVDAARDTVEVLGHDWAIGGAVETRVLCASTFGTLGEQAPRTRVLLETGPVNERGEREWELATVSRGK
jgi:hypothetical protein